MQKQKLHILLCFGQHSKRHFREIVPLIEKFKPDAIAPEGADYTESLRSRVAGAFRIVRRRLNSQAGNPPSRRKINSLLGPFPPEDGLFAECEYREALARNIAYFPVEIHKKTPQFMEDDSEFTREQFKVPFSLPQGSSWNSASKESLEKTAHNFLFASRKFAISSIERENDIIRSMGSYQDGLLQFYPELSGNGGIRVFAHFGTYHVGIHYFGKRHYSGNGDIQLSGSMVSLDCCGNLCSMSMRFGELPPAGLLYRDLILLSQVSNPAYKFLEKNEDSAIKVLKPLISHLKTELLP